MGTAKSEEGANQHQGCLTVAVLVWVMTDFPVIMSFRKNG